MRRTFGFLICIALSIAACNKTTTPGLTTEEQLDKDINMIDEYIASKGLTVVSLESGIRYVITEMGTGALPTAKNCVLFRYSGHQLYDTASFGENLESGLKSPLVSLVAGMQLGMKLMPVGTKGTIFMPSGYAYGTTGIYDAVSASYIVNPNTPLWFDVEILQLYDYNTAGNYCY
jgi:FKBP-type peptidyl-prolyl cis-trans isomerase FkpA